MRLRLGQISRMVVSGTLLASKRFRSDDLEQRRAARYEEPTTAS